MERAPIGALSMSLAYTSLACVYSAPLAWNQTGVDSFAGTWTVIEQNRMLGFCFGLSEVNEA